MKDRNIPNPRHIEWEAIHGAERPGDRHHIVDNIVIRLRLGQRYRRRIDQSVIGLPDTVEALIGVVAVPRESVEDVLAMVEAHVGDIPVFFLADAAQDGP